MRSCKVFLILLQSLLISAQEINFQAEPVQINGSTVDTDSLIDRRIPSVLTDLEGNSWAERLVTVPRNTLETGSIQMVVDFRDVEDYQGQQVMELVMFNCLDWAIGADSIRIYAGSDLFARHEEFITDYTVTTRSCDHLVHLCINTDTTFPVLNIEFFGSDWVHIAEVILHDQGPSPLDENPVPINCPSTLMVGGTGPSTEDQECTTSIVIFSAISVGIETVFVTIIFIIIQICICKHFRRTKQRNSPSASGKAKITNGTNATDSKAQAIVVSGSGVNPRYSAALVGGAKTSPVSPRKNSNNNKPIRTSMDRRLPGIPPSGLYLQAQKQDTGEFEYDTVQVVDPKQPAEYEAPADLMQDEYEEVGDMKAPPITATKPNSTDMEEGVYEYIDDPKAGVKSIDHDDHVNGDGDGTYILPGDVGLPSMSPEGGDQPPPLYLRLSRKDAEEEEDENAYVIP